MKPWSRRSPKPWPRSRTQSACPLARRRVAGPPRCVVITLRLGSGALDNQGYCPRFSVFSGIYMDGRITAQHQQKERLYEESSIVFIRRGFGRPDGMCWTDGAGRRCRRLGLYRRVRACRRNQQHGGHQDGAGHFHRHHLRCHGGFQHQSRRSQRGDHQDLARRLSHHEI